MRNNRRHISVIIPVLNEAACIESLLAYLDPYVKKDLVKEVLVVDGGSTDGTAKLTVSGGARLLHSAKGRARQMNTGARDARGNVFYFLHADTIPPANFHLEIFKALSSGYGAGCFRLSFDSDKLFLRFFSWCSRLNLPICRGGDQSLFINRELFESIGGFDERFMIYEDNEFIGRIYKASHFKIIPKHVRTSARRYRARGMLKLQYHFGMIHLKKYFGTPPDKLYEYYKRNIAL